HWPLVNTSDQGLLEKVAGHGCELAISEFLLAIFRDEAPLHQSRLVVLVDELERVDAEKGTVRVARRRIVLLVELGHSGTVGMGRSKFLECGGVGLACRRVGL